MLRFRLVLTLGLGGLLVACGGRDPDLPDLGEDLGTSDMSMALDLGGGTDLGPPVDLGDDLGPPDCSGVTTCAATGVSCDGNTRVVCGRSPSGCLVETRTDCAAMTGGTCSMTGGAHCAADPCFGLPVACTTPSRTCMGDVLTTCAPGTSGCLVSTSVDCASIGSTCLPDGIPPDGGVPDGGVPDGGTGAASCSAPDPCYMVDPATRCTTEGRTCDTATSLTDCHPNVTGCLVSTRTDCLAGASPLAHCDATAATPVCVDPCLGLTLCAPTDPAQRCVGSRIVSCTPDPAGCYVRTEVNCATTGMGCDPTGATPVCSGDLCPSAAGTIDCSGVLPKRITSNTASTSTVLPSNSCNTLAYPGHEGIWVFSNPVGAVAHVTLASVVDTTHQYGIFVLDGTGSACDPSAPCLASATSAPTTVDFSVPAGGRRYVVVDGRDATSTTSYALLVDCDLCGDGIVTPPEQCDDHNATRGDGCDDSCFIEAGWACTGAPSTCHRTVCGNGIAEPGETCDDGNTAAGDGCSPTCLAETFTAVPAAGGSLSVSGSLTASDPTFTRPYQDCTTSSGTAGVSYDTWVLQNTHATPLTVTITATWGVFGDGYLFAYSTPFSATMPGADCVDGDDDYTDIIDSQVTITIAPGAQVVLVATEFDPGSAAGPYTLQIQSM